MSVTTPGPHPARIRATVYKGGGGIEWRIESAARGRRIIAVSSEAYVRKQDAFRGLLLTTGGEYERGFRSVFKRRVYEQGQIVRPLPWGGSEAIFVEYLGGAR